LVVSNKSARQNPQFLLNVMHWLTGLGEQH